MSPQVQQTVFGEPIEETVRIETTGRVIRPFKRMLDPWGRKDYTEYKLWVDVDGIRVRYVNPSNTALVINRIEPEAFDSFDVDELTVLGVNSQSFGSALRHARYGVSTDDELTITADSSQLQTVTHREIADQKATITEQFDLIDPDSIRESDEVNIDEDMLTAEVDLSADAFIEVVRMLDDSSGTATKFKQSNGVFEIQQEQDVERRNIQLEVGEGNAEAMFSSDMVARISNALHMGFVDDVTMKWGDEFPVFVEFEREDVYSGEIMLAPRVTRE